MKGRRASVRGEGAAGLLQILHDPRTLGPSESWHFRVVGS